MEIYLLGYKHFGQLQQNMTKVISKIVSLFWTLSKSSF